MKTGIGKVLQVCIIVMLFLFVGAVVSAKEYKRIISLAPSITESVYELGLEQLVKGITVYCPIGTIKKEIIGTLLEPDIEKIVLLNPDLIISTKDGNNKAVIEKFKRLNFEVYVMETAENFKEICENYYNLAEKLNREKEAKKIIDTASNSVEKIYKKLNDSCEFKLFWEIEAKPLYTAGNKSFVNDYNYYIKTVNIYKNTNMRYFSVDIEDIVVRNPDIIILVNMGNVNNQELENWTKYKMINAVKNNKVFMINSKNMFAPTPMTFANGVGTLANVIYGDIFNAE